MPSSAIRSLSEGASEEVTTNYARVQALRVIAEFRQYLWPIDDRQVQVKEHDVGTRQASWFAHVCYERYGFSAVVGHVQLMRDAVFFERPTDKENVPAVVLS